MVLRNVQLVDWDHKTEKKNKTEEMIVSLERDHLSLRGGAIRYGFMERVALNYILNQGNNSNKKGMWDKDMMWCHGKTPACRLRSLRFISWFSYLILVWPWTNHLPSQGICPFICK